jgi:histidinol-phosphate aminotransferase
MSAGPAPACVAAVIRDEVRAMSGYHVPAAAGLVKLDAMENPYPLPGALRDSLARVLAQVPLNRYPVPDYAALKALLRSRMRVPDGAELLLGNGSDELIQLIATATARPGATVLAPWPGFVMVEIAARLAGSRFVGVPLRADFALDTQAMLAAIARERPAVVIIAYPNNPTGNCFDPAAIAAVLEQAPGLVVIDEAYQPFAPDSWMPRLPAHPNLLVLRTVSKLGLAGLRLGYLAGAPAWIAQLEKIRPPYNVNALTEAAALHLLAHGEVFDEQADRLRAARAGLAQALRALPGLTVFDSQANFLLVRVAGGPVAGSAGGPAAAATGGAAVGAGCGPAVWRALRERGVLVKDVGTMHPLLTDCLRVTVGTAEENALLVDALAAILARA